MSEKKHAMNKPRPWKGEKKEKIKSPEIFLVQSEARPLAATGCRSEWGGEKKAAGGEWGGEGKQDPGFSSIGPQTDGSIAKGKGSLGGGGEHIGRTEGRGFVHKGMVAPPRLRRRHKKWETEKQEMEKKPRQKPHSWESKTPEILS